MDSQFILEASFDVGLSFCDTGVGGMQLTIVLVYFLHSGNRDNSSSTVTRKCLMYEFCDPASFTVGFWACVVGDLGVALKLYMVYEFCLLNDLAQLSPYSRGDSSSAWQSPVHEF